MTIKKLLPILTLIATGMVSIAPQAEAIRLIEKNDPYEADLSPAIDENFSSSIGTEMFSSDDINFENPMDNIQLNTAIQITNPSNEENAVGNLVTMYGLVYPTVEFNTSMEFGAFQNDGAHEIPEPSTILALATIASFMGISNISKKKKNHKS